MHTTLDLDEDLLAAVREIAARERKPLGQVASRLLRMALAQAPRPAAAGSVAASFRAFASRGVEVTDADIERLRDKQGV